MSNSEGGINNLNKNKYNLIKGEQWIYSMDMFPNVILYLSKIAQSLGPILGIFILLRLNFVRGAPTQRIQAQFGILFLFFMGNAIVHFLGLVGILYFSLHDEKLEKKGARLLKIHDKKLGAFSFKNKI